MPELSQQHLLEILKTEAIGVFQFDLTSGTFSMDDTYAAFLGYEKEELNSIEAWRLLIHSEYTEKINGVLTGFLEKTDSPVTVEMALQHKKGHFVWAKSTFLKNDDGSITCASIDISEARESNHLFTEKLYRTAFDNLNEEVHLWEVLRDKTGNIQTWKLVDANRLALKTWQKKEEVIGKTANEIFGADATQTFMPIVEKIYSTGLPEQWQAYFPPTRQYLSMSSIPIGDFFISTGKDITEAKQAEQQLIQAKEKVEESERRLMLAAQSAQLGIWDWNVKENRLTWDDRMYELYGVDKNSPLKTVELWSEGVHPDDKEKATARLQDALAGKASFDTTFRVIHPDGKIAHIKADGLVLRDVQGNATRMIGINRDITEVKRKELALQKEKERAERTAVELRESQKVASLGSWYLDLATNELTWSEELYKIFGFNPDLPIPAYTEHMKRFTPESWDMLLEAVKKTRETGEPYELELEMVTAGKKGKGWMWLKGEAVFDNQKNIIGLRGVNQDITEQKMREKEMQHQNEALKKVNAELDNFVYRVSHDLRAPITSSLGLTSLCIDLCSEPEVKDLLHKQLKSLHKLDTFIYDILNYSRNTRLELQKKPIDFKSFIEEITHQYTATYSSVELRISIEEQAPLVTDETRLTMIFNNLISNAFKFLAPYKKTSFIEINADIKPEIALIKVTDNGIGIQQEYLDQIFNMFFRATDRNYGSGLGLYITKEAVEKMGGTISVESDYEEGTSFTVTLPNNSTS